MACNTDYCALVNAPVQSTLYIGSPLTVMVNYGFFSTPWANRPYTECTFGFIAVQRATNRLVGVSVGNLLTSNPTITEDRLDPQNTLVIDTYYKFPFTRIYGKYSTTFSSVYNIGVTSICNPLYSTPSSGPITYNQANAGLIYPQAYGDCSVVMASGSTITPSWNLQPYTYLGTKLTEPMMFATTSEIDAITPYTKILIAGFNQLKEINCGVQINSVNDTYTFSFNGIAGTFPFNHLLNFTRIDPACGDPVTSKDSGATIAAYIGNKWKIIGIVIGFNGGTGYGSRIDYIADQLGLDAWDGSVKGFNTISVLNYYSDSVNFKTRPGLNNIKSFEESNTVYNQIGTSTLTLP